MTATRCFVGTAAGAAGVCALAVACDASASAVSAVNAIRVVTMRSRRLARLGMRGLLFDGARCFFGLGMQRGPKLVPLGCCGYLKEEGREWQRGSGRGFVEVTWEGS